MLCHRFYHAVLHRFQEIVQRVPFFKGLKENVIVNVCMELHEFAVMPGDTITARGDPYRELVIMIRGTARSVPSSDQAERQSVRGITQAASARNRQPNSSCLATGLDVVVEFDRGMFFGTRFP